MPGKHWESTRQNFVLATPRPGGTAAVTLSPGADQLVILVEDEGPGIPRSEREKAFEPFYRIGSARDPSTGRVGLGFSVIVTNGAQLDLLSRPYAVWRRGLF